MNKDKYVFAQLIEFLDNNKFRHLVDKYDGNRYVKHFTCWNQLLAMMFGQLSNRESLRDLIVAFEAHRAKQYHLGLGRNPIAKTTFASANQNRDYRIFEDFAFWKYPEKLRLVKFYDEEQGREFAFLTNAFHLTAPEIANLYKNRWQIELFFKWLKQHLKIKKFWGTTENAVRIQISSAIIAYCLVAIVHHDLQLKRSTYEVLQILSISLMDKTPLVDLFERTDFNNVKELDCPLFPGLFD